MVRHSAIALSDGIMAVITAPRSPWQNPYVERLIGLIRRECLDHVIVLNERHLRRVLSSYCQYHHDFRTHLSLDKDCPWPRRVQLPSAGNIIAFPEVGGLHHRYERGGTLPVPALNRAKLNFEQGQQDILSPFSNRYSPEKHNDSRPPWVGNHQIPHMDEVLRRHREKCGSPTSMQTCSLWSIKEKPAPTRRRPRGDHRRRRGPCVEVDRSGAIGCD